MQIETTSDFLGTHPVIGSVISLFFILIAAAVEQVQIPLIVMQSAQLLAWIGAILVAAMTVYGKMKSNIKNQNKPE